jgi:hypothetical protein
MMPQKYYNAVKPVLEELTYRCIEIGDDGVTFACAMSLVEAYIRERGVDRDAFFRTMISTLIDELGADDDDN